MNTTLRTLGAINLVMAFAAANMSMPAHADTPEQSLAEAASLVEKGQKMIRDFTDHTDFASLKSDLAEAKGVLLFPKISKISLVIGGAGGTGLLLRHDEATGSWTGPAFYSLGGASVGLQAGAASAEVIMVVKSQKALDSLYSNKLKIGVDASAALGSKGIGRGAALSTDFVIYAKEKGAFVGLALDGTVLDIRESLNAAYYGKPITPVDILVQRSSPRIAGATALQETMSSALRTAGK